MPTVTWTKIFARIVIFVQKCHFLGQKRGNFPPNFRRLWRRKCVVVVNFFADFGGLAPPWGLPPSDSISGFVSLRCAIDASKSLKTQHCLWNLSFWGATKESKRFERFCWFFYIFWLKTKKQKFCSTLAILLCIFRPPHHADLIQHDEKHTKCRITRHCRVYRKFLVRIKLT